MPPASPRRRPGSLPRTVRSLRVDWKEDVRKWHPGQAWIWEPGGFGVFDPGINALSIVTEILPMPIFLTSATLLFPKNRAQPIAADLVFADSAGEDRASATFDWRQTGPQTWDIQVITDDGELLLQSGGAKLFIKDELVVDQGDVEYADIYRRFAELIAKRRKRCRPSPAAPRCRRFHGWPAHIHRPLRRLTDTSTDPGKQADEQARKRKRRL